MSPLPPCFPLGLESNSGSRDLGSIPNPDTDAFIDGLLCFIAIRGAVKQIRSNQGKNFVEVNNELTKALKEMETERPLTWLKDNVTLLRMCLTPVTWEVSWNGRLGL